MTEPLSQIFKERIDRSEDIAVLQEELKIIERILCETGRAEIQEEMRLKRDYILSRISKLQKRRIVR